MKDWKLKQEIYHRLNRDYTDQLTKFNIVLDQNIVDNAVKYFTTMDIGWVYPAKSYMVAICYARWISEDFDEDFYSLLDDPTLLHGNDPHFIPYNQDKKTYDRILEKVGGLQFDQSKGHCPGVREYYEEEFAYE